MFCTQKADYSKTYLSNYRLRTSKLTRRTGIMHKLIEAAIKFKLTIKSAASSIFIGNRFYLVLLKCIYFVSIIIPGGGGGGLACQLCTDW